MRKTAITLAALAALGAAPAAAQVVGNDPDMGDAVLSPLEDVDLAQEGVDPALVAATADPYAHEDLATCNDIVAEIAEIDRVLGNDFDVATETNRELSPARIARTIVRSFVPFRRIIREISGAEDRERRVEIAVTAGMVRRGYLKGLGQARGCDYPASPHPDRTVWSVSEYDVVEDAREEDEEE